MSLGGWLVVMDRAGRNVKHYRLRVGSVTLGSDPACDIRVMVPTVSPHHATVSALCHQTVVRSVSERETLVNGTPVSVAALRHGDVISLGGRTLRWEYQAPGVRRPLAPEPALLRRVQRARAPRRGSEPPPRNVIVPEGRASMPASASGKQVAIVQPQRRDTSDLSDASSPRLPPNKRPRISRNVNNSVPSAEPAEADGDRTKRRSGASTRDTPNLAETTKATLWIESRKTSPRKSLPKTIPPPRTPAMRTNVRRAVSAKKTTPLRTVVLKRAQSAQKVKVTKIQAPLKMDSTKQAAIMLMTRHTPKSKQTSLNQGNKGPSFVVKKPSPVRETPKNRRSSGRRTSPATPAGGRSSMRHSTSDNRCPSLIEITDSETRLSTRESSVTRRSGKRSLRSPHFTSPKKSALKNPNAKRSSRKTESIKFDLSNLDNATYNRSSDVMLVNDTGNNSSTDDSESDFTLRFSDISKSPSPRKSINSRSRRMLENTLGVSVTLSPKSDRRTLTAESPQSKKSLRGSIILQEALRINNSDGTEISTYSRRTTKSLSDQSWSTTIASTRRTRTLSPRASRNNLESYSIVDLVSVDSNDSTASRSGSIYTSADSNRSVTYDTPESQNLTSVSRRALGCSTPYDLNNQTPVYELLGSSARTRNSRTRLSNRNGAAGNDNTSVTTPENTEDTAKSITLNSTKISRASKKRFRIITRQNALIFMDDDLSEDDSSPKSSKRSIKGSQASPLIPKNISVNETFAKSPSINEGIHTPENRHSPVEASTPVLNIRSLLDASQNSNTSSTSVRRRMSKRKTIAAVRSEPRRGRTGMKSKSLNFKTYGRGRRMLDNFDASDDSTVNVEEEVVTPKSAVKPLPEGVKNKHSSAKKPQSKRSLIDNLNESDIVKQLFNSPVKRKLSQSMTEFSRRHLFDEEDRPRRPTRATKAVAGRSPDNSLMDHTERFTPEIFVSPLNTPSHSPDMTGIKRLFQKNIPDNDLRNVRGVKTLLRTPRTRKSTKNELSNVSAVKSVFAKSPRNRLTDVRIKDIFAASPNNDLRRVSGVKDLFQSQRRKGRTPKNELDDLRGVRTLFKDYSPSNDLRNVSGVKRILQRNSPSNDLTDVRGVKQMFRQDIQTNELSDLSGVEQLFHESTNYDSTFDQLLGRPPIRAVYSKSKSFTTTSKVQKRGKKRMSKSLHDVGLITNNVEEWLEKELTERLQRNAPAESSGLKGRKSANTSKYVSKTTRELQKLNTDTVNGSVPVINNRTRNSSIVINVQSELSLRKKSASELYGAHTLPIKKRSLVEAAPSKSSNDRSHKLPIKKRAVVHSTPVKGRVNMTMNASEIGRMSPISSEDKTMDTDNLIRSQRQVLSRTKSPQSKIKPPEGTQSTEKPTEVVKLSPKKTRSTKAAPASPAPARKRRGAKPKAENQEVLNVKKRRSSIVITKRTPVLGPKVRSPRVTRKGKTIQPVLRDVPRASPKKTRSTRSQKSQVSAEGRTDTPKKNIRAKVSRVSVIDTKQSPKLNPRATRNTKNKIANSQPEHTQPQAKRPRNVTVAEPKPEGRNRTNKQAPESARGERQSKRKLRKTTAGAALAAPTVDKSVSIIQTRRTRKTAVEAAQVERPREASNVRSKRTRKVGGGDVEELPAGRGRRGRAAGPVSEPNESATKNSAPKSVARGRDDPGAPRAEPTRGRKAKREVPHEHIKNTASEELPTRRGRKRKNTEREDVGNELAETMSGRLRGRRGDAGDSKTAPGETAATRGARSAVAVEPKKGRKTSSVADNIPVAVGRKKRTNVKESDAKDDKEQTSKKPREAAAPRPCADMAAAGTSRGVRGVRGVRATRR